MTYSAKVQGQWSVGSEDRMETNRRTDRRTVVSALPPTIMRSVMSVIYMTVFNNFLQYSWFLKFACTIGRVLLSLLRPGMGAEYDDQSVCV